MTLLNSALNRKCSVKIHWASFSVSTVRRFRGSFHSVRISIWISGSLCPLENWKRTERDLNEGTHFLVFPKNSPSPNKDLSFSDLFRLNQRSPFGSPFGSPDLKSFRRTGSEANVWENNFWSWIGRSDLNRWSKKFAKMLIKQPKCSWSAGAYLSMQAAR